MFTLITFIASAFSFLLFYKIDLIYNYKEKFIKKHSEFKLKIYNMVLLVLLGIIFQAVLKDSLFFEIAFGALYGLFLNNIIPNDIKKRKID